MSPFLRNHSPYCINMFQYHQHLKTKPHNLLEVPQPQFHFLVTLHTQTSKNHSLHLPTPLSYLQSHFNHSNQVFYLTLNLNCSFPAQQCPNCCHKEHFSVFMLFWITMSFKRFQYSICIPWAHSSIYNRLLFSLLPSLQILTFFLFFWFSTCLSQHTFL